MENAEVMKHNAIIGKRAVEALRKHGFPAEYYETAAEAREVLLSLIEDGSSVGFGGSVTIAQMDIQDELKTRNCTIYDHGKGKTPEEKLEFRHKEQDADYFLTGSNAVTLNGELYNVDATGNRVSAMVFGPKHVIVVAGVNKIVKDIEAAEKRGEEVAAPANALRLNRETPCFHTGTCADCMSPQRLCNVAVIMKRRPPATDMRIMIIGETMGY